MIHYEPEPGSPARQGGGSDPTDLQLVVLANNGRAEAFEELYLRYKDWVAQLAWRFTRDHDLALDVMQETFLYFLKKFPGFELRCELKTFLYPAVKNLSISALRKTQRLEFTDLVPDLPAAPEGSDNRDLTAFLEQLPRNAREILLLRFLEGFSLEEIAAALGIPLGTVKSRLHYALGELRKNPKTKMFLSGAE